MKLSDNDLLNSIQEVAEEVERIPSLQDYRDHGEYSAMALYNHFGSWRESLEAAGFEPREPQTEIPDEALMQELQRLADEIDKVPSINDMTDRGEYWASTYRNHFGSWTNALEAAGFDPPERGVQQSKSDEELLSELKRIADEDGSPPTFQEMAECGKYSPRTYGRRFGSWNEAVEAAGFESKNKPGELSEEELISELRQLADDLGREPVSTDLAEHGGHAVATYQRRFGSWSAAKEAAFDDSDH